MSEGLVDMLWCDRMKDLWSLGELLECQDLELVPRPRGRTWDVDIWGLLGVRAVLAENFYLQFSS
eukprot:5914108-Pyramimonas_sp.AAC.1